MEISAKQELTALLKKTKFNQLNISELPVLQGVQDFLYFKRKYKALLLLVGLIFAKYHFKNLFNDERCLIAMPDDLQKLFRPPENCKFCRGVKEAPRLQNVSPDEFEDSYAYSGGPVVITDATSNWTALEIFDYWYFRDIYQNSTQKWKISNCQFFPYKSGFKSLFDAFRMDDRRAAYMEGTEPWYFGWSNCNAEIVKIFREHYGRPYFLPPTSENHAGDWIFMGWPGFGAHMHVDNVRLPSWQAQLKGTKKWILAPPPECYYECESFEVVVQTGDIIVLDTNKWYHKTIVMAGEMSITIGAEYD